MASNHFISSTLPCLSSGQSVLVVTHSPSPYQVELFDEVEKQSDFELWVIYLFGADPSRSWGRSNPEHQHLVLTDNVTHQAELLSLAENADLLIINYYRHPWINQMLGRRVHSGKAWCLWGERPGFQHPFLGRLLRTWSLRALHRSKTQIWGIGAFAIQGYQKEFGSKRQYVNMPYFSDLRRFSECEHVSNRGEAERIILFSGALIPRKGVDLLAKAFVAAAKQAPNLHLHLMGSGELENELRAILAPVAEQVSFIGFRDWNDLPSMYAEADVLCVPSRYDGWGLVVPEGLAAGLPVIATKRMGAALDLLVDNENGWLIEADDEAAIESALLMAAGLADETLAGMSVAAQQSVLAHSLEQGAERFLTACDQAISGWPR